MRDTINHHNKSTTNIKLRYQNVNKLQFDLCEAKQVCTRQEETKREKDMKNDRDTKRITCEPDMIAPSICTRGTPISGK